MLSSLGTRSRIDLHLHTTRSDGAFSPEETLLKCARSGLDIVALTDHDLVNDITPGLRRVDDRDLWVIAGAEISGMHEGTEYHLLVYFPGAVPQRFRALCQQQCEQRAQRYDIAIQNLSVSGLVASDASARAGQRALTRLHLAQGLVTAGHATHIGDAFSRFVGNRAGTVPKLTLPYTEAIRIANECGGLTSWAHPNPDDIERHLSTLVKAGLHGVEALRPTTTRRTRNILRRAAKRHGLFLTGGSDWHGWAGAQVGLFGLQIHEISGFIDALEAA